MRRTQGLQGPFQTPEYVALNRGLVSAVRIAQCGHRLVGQVHRGPSFDFIHVGSHLLPEGPPIITPEEDEDAVRKSTSRITYPWPARTSSRASRRGWG